MTRNVKALRPVLAVLGAALSLTACLSSPPDQLSSGEGYSVLGALAEVPASAVHPDVPVTITTADLVGAAEAIGLDMPTTRDELRELQMLLTGAPVGDTGPAPMFVAYPDWLIAYQGEEDVDFGFPAVEVSSFVDVVTHPTQFTVVSGEWEEATPEAVLPEIGEGVFRFGEGEDLESRSDQASRLSLNGSPLRIAAQGGRVIVSKTTPAATDWLSGEYESLADDEEFAVVAAALDEAGALSSFIWSVDSWLTVPDADHVPKGPITTVAIGWAVEDGVSRISLVYHFESAEVAEAAVPTFERQYSGDVLLRRGQPLAEHLQLIGVESRERVAVVTVQPTPEGRPIEVLNMLMDVDVPFQQSE